VYPNLTPLAALHRPGLLRRLLPCRARVVASSALESPLALLTRTCWMAVLANVVAAGGPI
jgi:hypothetical protein